MVHAACPPMCHCEAALAAEAISQPRDGIASLQDAARSLRDASFQDATRSRTPPPAPLRFGTMVRGLAMTGHGSRGVPPTCHCEAAPSGVEGTPNNLAGGEMRLLRPLTGARNDNQWSCGVPPHVIARRLSPPKQSRDLRDQIAPLRDAPQSPAAGARNDMRRGDSAVSLAFGA